MNCLQNILYYLIKFKKIYLEFVKDYILYQDALEFNFSLDDFYFFIIFIPILFSVNYRSVNVGYIVYWFGFIDWLSENKTNINYRLFILWLNKIKFNLLY